MQNIIRLQYPDIYTPFVQIPRRYKIISGGRGSAKSRFYALMACKVAAEGGKVVCAREFQSSIKHSVYELIKATILNYGLEGFDIKKTEIEHRSGGSLIFIGIGRNPDAARSLEGAAVCWVEEAQFLTADTIRTLTPSIRGDDSEIWMSGNPLRVADPFSQKFIERKLDLVIPEYPRVQCDHLYMRLHTTYADNPWFPNVLELERQDDYEMLDRALYDHVWGGMYNDSVEHAIIRAEWVDAAIDAHKRWKSFGLVTAIHDPADSGDARGTIIRHGNTILKLHQEKRKDINDSCEQACDMAKEYNASAFTWDATGCGLGLRKQIYDYFPRRRHGAVTLTEFQGGATPQNPHDTAILVNGIPVTNNTYFKNLRSQLYYRLSERFRKTYLAVTKDEYIDPHELISIASDAGDISQFKSELSSIPRKMNAERCYQLMGKNEMISKLKVKSPNLADCAMMSEMQLIQFDDWSTDSGAPDLGMV